MLKLLIWLLDVLQTFTLFKVSKEPLNLITGINVDFNRLHKNLE